jgi:hypothetical protein
MRPAFDEAVMSAELPIRKPAANMLGLLLELDLPQLRNLPGLNFEKLHAMVEPSTGRQLYSLRVTGSSRAIICLLNGPTIVLVTLHIRHDRVYRKKGR